VWADEQLQELLLDLPLPAMQLLLSSDQLRVAAEDTVLYTATRFSSLYGGSASGRSAARAALAPLVRELHMSVFALSTCTVSARSSRLFLGELSEQL
jgi:hypothetical protein